MPLNAIPPTTTVANLHTKLAASEGKRHIDVGFWGGVIPDNAADLQPLAVSLANYVTNVAASTANPYGAILAGAVVLAAPVVTLFIVFQRWFTSTDVGSAVKG